MDALLKLVAVINAPLMVKFSSVPGQIFYQVLNIINITLTGVLMISLL